MSCSSRSAGIPSGRDCSACHEEEEDEEDEDEDEDEDEEDEDEEEEEQQQQHILNTLLRRRRRLNSLKGEEFKVTSGGGV